jgi:UDP-glucose 4-epimerase
MKNILITGGAGFVGINLVRYLINFSPHKITVLDNLSAGNLDLLKEVVAEKGRKMEYRFTPDPAAVCFLKMDILQREKIDRALEGQQGIVHLAAQTGVIPSLQDPLKDAEVNITGTLNLLEAAVKHHIEAFVFASSAAPLGEQEPPMDETKIPHPLSPYGAGKLAGEGYCSAFYGSFGLNTVVLRFSNVYGPYSFHKGSVIAHFIKRILAGKHLVIYGDGYQTRDFLYVEDVCRIIGKILETHNSKSAGEIFQLGTGVETSINELILLLKNLIDKEVEIRFEPERKGEIKRNFTNPRKLLRQLGIKTETKLETGLKRTWEWFTREAEKLRREEMRR